MKTITSAGANKLIKMLEDRKTFLLTKEAESALYILAENEKTIVPEYDYAGTKEELEKIDGQIRNLKHRINIFNTTTFLESVGLYIDEALVQMAQLNKRKEILSRFRSHLPRQRVNSAFYGKTNNLIEYEYTNYDIQEVMKDYDKICQKIVELQLALDHCNQTQTFEIEDLE